MDNQEFLKRAEIMADDIATVGKLSPEQTAKFIDYVFDLSVLKGLTRQIRFASDQYYINKIGVGNRVAWPAQEGVDPGFRRGVSTSRVTLTPKDLVVPFEISDRFIRYNIEGDSVEDHVIRMMATQLANDIDILFLDGNTVGPGRIETDIFDEGSSTQYRLDRLLAQMDGFLKLSESGNTYDAANAALSGTLFNKTMLQMPVKYRRNKNNLRFLISPDHEQGYRELMSQRGTPLGDSALQTPQDLTPFGIRLSPVPNLEPNPLYVENSVANNDGTTATSLTYAPHDNLALLPTTLNDNLTSKYVVGVGNDYTEVEASGTWTRLTGGNIGSAATVKATYNTKGKMLLTDPMNLIYAIGEEVFIEKDRNIMRRMNEYAIHTSVACQIENVEAVCMLYNIADPAL
jgi:hypothetical protein